MEHRTSKPPQLDIDFVHDASNADFDPYNIPVEPSSPLTAHTTKPKTTKPTNNRARNESRKLVSHVLWQLANRPKPRAALEAAINPAAEGQDGGLGAFAQSLKDAVKSGLKPSEVKQHKRPGKVDPDDSDDEAETTFSTDQTFDLMSQLKDVLAMSFAQGWRIFDDEPSSFNLMNEAVSNTYSSRQSRSSFRGVASRSRSASPSSSTQVHIPELLALCVSVLGSVVLEDCRYRILAPRPSRPPNALQSLTLSVAQFLIHHHGRDPQVISQISTAMIPAFYTFPESMYARLLTFFESSVIGIITGNLEQLNPLHRRPAVIVTSPGQTGVQSPVQDHSMISIHVDEVATEPNSADNGLSLGFSSLIQHQVQSTNNPDQHLTVYRLSALIPPLFNAIFDTLQEGEYSSRCNGHWDRVIRFLRIFSAAKLDLYNDILEIVAYHGPKARRGGIAALSAVWPRPAGHSYISGSFCPSPPHYTHDNHNDKGHQFISWYFISGNRPRFSDTSFSDCKCCSRPIHGFGLKCPLCFISVHFDCYDYPNGNYQIPYIGSQNNKTQRIAMFRYSFAPLPQETDLGPTFKLGHRFQANTWFTMTLCHCCRLPLWGCFGQGLWCTDCSVACHPYCVTDLGTFCSSTSVTLDHLAIEHDVLRDSCVAQYPILQFSRSQLMDLTFEEAGAYFGILRIQLQLLVNGIAMGSIIVTDHGLDTNDKTLHSQKFELHNVLDSLDAIVRGINAIPSPSTQQYLDDNHISKDQRPLLMFDWSYLCYITTSLKSVIYPGQSVKSDYLSVQQPFAPDSTEDPVAHPQEARSASTIREILKVEFGIRSEHASQLVLDHMLYSSLLDLAIGKVDGNPVYTFPLPLGLDLSVNVETLVSAIEACFGDLDLSSNEFGFLLLTKRLWPNGLMSDYALKRLAEKVLLWILDEDHNLAIVLREFVAKQRALPGVSTARYPANWPLAPDSRLGIHANNGGDYVAARRALLSRYAVPWLRELHDLDTELYTSIIVDVCSDPTRDTDFMISSLSDVGEKTSNASLEEREQVLRFIVKLSQNSVLFSSFDPIFLLWMEKTVKFGWEHKYMTSLQRLFAHENETLQVRSSTHMDILSTTSAFIDPLQAIINLANQADDGLTRSLRCLLMCIRSGALVPMQIFIQFLALISTSSPHCLQDASILTECVMLTLWIRSLGRQELQNVISQIHEKLSSRITACLVTGTDVATGLRIIRHSLGSCLRIYGCERSSITLTGIVLEDETRELPSRRKIGGRASRSDDPVFVQPHILAALQTYLDCNVEEVSCFLIHFLNTFLMESPLLEAFEVDNFILRNGKLITSCVWKAYGIQRDDIALARTNLLLRSLLIDGEPFQEILLSKIHGNVSTENKLLNLNHMFRMVSDVTSPAFDVEGRQWRSSVVEIFYHYLSALWQDPQEEIRLSVRASTAALLPAHFELISQCWKETLLKTPISERLRLLSFLIQLHPNFPTWKVVPWDAILDTLVEYDFEPKGPDASYEENYNGSEKSRIGTVPNDLDLVKLKVLCVLLALQLLSNGIEIDGFSLMKIKVHLIQLAGFSRVAISPTPSGQSFYLQFSDITELNESVYPCIEEMAHVVDAASYVDLPLPALGLPEGQEEKSSESLVGTIFIDAILILISTLRDLLSLPVLTLKSVLESLYILTHKYDFDHPTLKHLQPLFRRAVIRTTELISKDVSYELRQVSLSICSAAIKKWHNLLGPVVTTILELVGTQISSETLSTQDPLMIQGRQLINNTLQTFHSSGLLVSLMKRQLPDEYFSALAQITNGGAGKEAGNTPLADFLLRDTLSRGPDVDSSTYQVVLNNISTFVRIVYYQGYNAELLSYAGQQLTLLSRRLSDGSIVNPDPTPILMTLSVLLQNNRKNAKDLLPSVDNILRITLNRLSVGPTCLKQLLLTPANAKPQEYARGVLLNIVYEILLDGFRMKTKMLPLTIASTTYTLIEAISQQPGHTAQANIQSNLMWDACNYLHHHLWADDCIEQEFDASTAVAKLVLHTASQDPVSFQKCIDLPTEKITKLSQILRSWNIMLLAALHGSHEERRSIILDHFTIFSGVFSTLFKGYAQHGITSLETATTDVNQGHIAMKLWLTLVHFQSRFTSGGERMIFSVWSELWSAYEGFLNVLETEAQVSFYATLISLTSSSMADLFIYMRSLRTSVALDTSQHMSVINRLRTMSQGDSTSQKLQRAMRSISEPPAEIPLDAMLEQIRKELIAAEKLRMIEYSGRSRK